MKLSSSLSRWLVPAVLALPGLAGLVSITGCNRAQAVAADQPVPVRLRLPHSLREPVSVSASGSVEANVTAQVAFQVSGRVAHVYAEEGQYVKQGQVLAALDCADYKNAFDSAAGQAAAAEAAALQAKNGFRAQEVEQARVEFEHAQDQYQRHKYLYDHQSLPANEFHTYETAYLVAQQRYEIAKEGARLEEKAATAGQANAATASFSEARKRVGDCQLRAPITGQIGMRKVEVGDTASVGTPVFSVLDLDIVKVRVGVPEAEIGKVFEGARAMVTIPSLDNQQFEGKVEAISAAADLVSRTFSTKIAIPNRSHILRAGMVSESRVFGKNMVDVLTVPTLAVARDLRGLPYVYVYDSSRQRVFARRVDLGPLADGELEIKTGLKSDDQIVVAGQQNVHEGSKVTLAGGAQ